MDLNRLLRKGDQLRDRGQRFCNRAFGNRFAIEAAADETVITIYDEIGFFGITASQIRRQLDAISTPKIRVRINSPGGDVFDGLAISNDLKSHPARVHVQVTALAASAASIIAMAGDTIEMADNAFMMIHNAWAIAIGDRNTMMDLAELLEQIDGALALTYAGRTKIDTKTIAKMMDDETWLSAAEAKEKGFADTITGEDAEPKALFDLGAFANVPGALKNRIEAGLRDAGMSRTEAKTAISQGFGRRELRDAAPNPPQRDAAREATVQGIKDLLTVIR